MAKKSKTQKARAAEARAKKKAQQDAAASQETGVVEASEETTEKPKKSLFKKAEADPAPVAEKKPAKKEKEEKKPAKKRFGFLSDVRAELRRVTWPTKPDVLRWSLVVLGALVFFGVYTLVLDNGIVTPVLVAISSLGA